MGKNKIVVLLFFVITIYFGKSKNSKSNGILVANRIDLLRS